MSAPEASGLSKSARKRANKKAREAEGEADEAPAPAPAPKAAAANKENASANAKAKAKSAPAPKAEPAPEAKAKPAAKPAAKKAAAKPAAKAATKPVEEPEVQKEVLVQPFDIDDGTGGEWGVASGMSKKQQKSQERRAQKLEEEKAMKLAAKQAPGGTNYIPGMAPVIDPKAKAAAAAPTVANVSVSAAAVTAKTEEPKVAQEVLSTATIKIPEEKVSRLIGPKGSTIAMIKEKTGIKTLEMTGDMCTLVGDPKAVAMAEVAVNEIVAKGFCSLAFEDYAEALVTCFKIDIPNIIGSKGETIIKIKDALKIEINMPQTDKDPKATPYKKVKITLAGATEGVEKGKEVLNSILTYGHHEITHPGVTHEELEIEPWQYSFIIGKGGSEMRHIQKNFHVKVNIPREQSTCQNVLVVGEPRDVTRASNYIWKVIEQAGQPRGRGAQDKAEDTWGDEGPVEDWMDAYMYKRT